MKTLFYTVATSDKPATRCSLMLYKSLVASLGSIDFKMAVPDGSEKSYPTDVRGLVLPSFKPNKSWKYVGDLKYTKSIYELDYDNFVYIDSDILWFLGNFDSSNNQLTTEKKILGDPWYSTGWTPKDKARRGACAGFFCISKDLGLSMSRFVSKRLADWGAVDAPKREQSTFNEFLEYCGYEKWKDVSSLIVGAARSDTKFSTGKMFHFQGWKGSMDFKYDHMSKFITYNNLKLLA